MRILHHHLGLIKYAPCLALQDKYHHMIKNSLSGEDGVILTLEHHPVISLGKNASIENLFVNKEFLVERGIDLVETDRGGEITAHMPGQLVMYPILPLQKMRVSPRQYVEILLSTVIDVLKPYGILAQKDPDFPGVWVDSSKICAIGIRIKERISLHGIALNIFNDFSLFDMMLPCGIKGRSVTSMQSFVSSPPSLLLMGDQLVQVLGQKLKAQVIKIKSLPDIPGYFA